jgi:hypothetical protein
VRQEGSRRFIARNAYVCGELTDLDRSLIERFVGGYLATTIFVKGDSPIRVLFSPSPEEPTPALKSRE